MSKEDRTEPSSAKPERGTGSWAQDVARPNRTLTERIGNWALDHPVVAAAIAAPVVGIATAAIPGNPEEDASAVEQALGVGIGAFVCLTAVFVACGMYADHYYGRGGADLRAKAAASERRLATAPRHMVALQVAWAFLRGALVGVVVFFLLLGADSWSSALPYGVGLGMYGAALAAWNVWRVRTGRTRQRD